MKWVRVGAAVLNQTPMDWEGNRRNILGAIAEARKVGVSILGLPELCISGYGCEDAFSSTSLQRKSLEVLTSLMPETKGMIVSVGLPLLYQNGLSNTAALLVDGQIAGFVAKCYLAGDGIHYEPRWFKPWPRGRTVDITIDGKSYPLGEYHFDCGGIKLGFEICEDAWVANRPGVELSQRGVDIILNPSASHFAFGKFETRKGLILEGSRAFGVSYVYSNLLGNESGRAIYDGGAMIASGGKLTAVGERFSFQNFQVTAAVIDIDDIRTIQSRTGNFEPEISKSAQDCITLPFSFPKVVPANEAEHSAPWEKSDRLKEEEFTRALALGLFDYLRKSGARGFIVSLSGGADSSSAACLVALMVSLGLNQLGNAEFAKKLSWPSETGSDIAKSWIHKLLLCVYQSTPNSSDITRNAAESVAAAIGAEFLQFDISQLVKDYVGMVEKGIGRKLEWKTDDMALQNIQARVRSPGIWLLANLRQALLLTTSNRSEAAVGYATMDGDTSGGLSPLGGIDKFFLRQWLTWLEKAGPVGLNPIPALSLVNQQAPTAELRPLSTHQTDEADLMPYEVLDAIERSAIRDKRSPVEVYELMRAKFAASPPVEMAHWVERFFKLWSRSQWKRERYAPSFHLDDLNLDPKTWCRFPILSGNFDVELKELKQLVAAGGRKP